MSLPAKTALPRKRAPSQSVWQKLVAIVAIAASGGALVAWPTLSVGQELDAREAYDRRVLSMLLESCKTKDLMAPAREAGAGLRNGWVWRSGDEQAERGTWVVVDVTRNQARVYRWEALKPTASRIRMPLALPRDLSACSIVETGEGRQVLQVTDQSVLIRSDPRQLWNQARPWTREGAARCGQEFPALEIVQDGAAVKLPACTPQQRLWAQEAVRWISRAQLQ